MRYVLNPDVEARSGRVGDTVTFMRNGRALSRRYVRPANPRSSHQNIFRSALIDAAAVWGTMTPTQRANWDSCADDNYADKVDSLGNPAPWSGQMLCTSRQFHAIIGGSGVNTGAYVGTIYTAPVVPSSFAISTSTNQVTIGFASPAPINGYMRYRITCPMHATDYHINDVLLRCPTKAPYFGYSYQYNLVSMTDEEWATGASQAYMTDAFKALEDGDIIGVELLCFGYSLLPAPSGPRSAVIQITKT
jgi:hypothetical protein